MKYKIVQGMAILLMLEIGLTHYFTAQHEYEDAWILGYLFIINFAGSLLAAYGIYRQKNWGWGLGIFIALGSLIGYIWSRTTGLPGLRPEDWLDPWGLAAVGTEILFCLMAFIHIWMTAKSDPGPVLQLRNRWRYVFSAIGLITLVFGNFSINQWEGLFPETDHGHVFFLWQVRLQPEISLRTLEDNYGMQLSLVADTAMSSIVDVRMKVLDPDKADQLLDEEAFSLLVGDTLIPAPHIHRHMLDNRTVILFFPNQKNIVKSGTPVSLVFADFHVEPVIAR